MVLHDAVHSYGAAVPPAKGPMLRTQIYLSQKEHEFVQGEAARQNVPMAAVIRSFIDEKMAVPADAWTRNPMLEPTQADPAFLGHEDGAINHDHYIYGCPKKLVEKGEYWVPAPAAPDQDEPGASGRTAATRGPSARRSK